jgi:hypothetical protein
MGKINEKHYDLLNEVISDLVNKHDDRHRVYATAVIWSIVLL